MVTYCMNQRLVRGNEIAEKNNQIIRIDETHYTVNTLKRFTSKIKERTITLKKD